MSQHGTKWGAVLCSIVMLCWTGQRAAADDFVTHTPIDSIEISNPEADEVWLAGSDHDVSISEAAIDEDCNTDTGQVVQDSVTHYWTGTGTFKDNDNVGTTATYICTNTTGENTVTAHADDDYEPESNTALADDDGVSDSETVDVIIPQVNTVAYTGGHAIADATSPQYDRASPRNDPTAYTIGVHQDVDVDVTFWHSTDLTEASSVQVYASPSTLALGEWGYPSGSFGTTWPSAGFSSTNRQVNQTSVSKLSYDETWYYRCPDGSDTWIALATIADRVMYVTRAAPVRAEPEVVFEYSVNYCAGLDGTNSDEDAGDEVLDGIAGDYTYAGTCAIDSSNFVRLIGIQGVSGTLHRWATNHPGAIPVGDINAMQTRPITLIGNDPGWPDGRTIWVNYHQWATAESYNWDASSSTKHAGGWGDYEDWLFNNGGTDDYRIEDSPDFWIANPNGQAAVNHPGMTYSNPGLGTFVSP